MKQDYERALNQISRIKDPEESFRYASLLAVLPVGQMLQNLLARKEKGKKPFSSDFRYDEKVKTIQASLALFEESLIAGDWKKAELTAALSSLEEIALSAQKEIKMASLREDFVWLGKEAENCRKALA
jgi:hypothetical protein